MPLQCDICEDIRIVPILWDVLTLRRDESRDPRFMGTRFVESPIEVTHELCRDFGRASLLCLFDVKAVRQHSLTSKFMVTQRAIYFECTLPTICS